MTPANTVRSALAAVLCATALVCATPASADDDTYLTTLETVGVPVDDPAAAVAMGHDACAMLDQGVDVQTVATRIGADNGLEAEDSGYVVGVAVAAYCDHHRAAVGH